MRGHLGYATLTSPPGTPHSHCADAGFRSLEQNGEADAFTCGHCQKIVHVPVRADPADIGGLCKQCMTCICPKCVDKHTCTPWEKQMVEMEAKQEALRSYGF